MDPTEQPPSTRSHLDGGGTEDNETIPTTLSPHPTPPLPAELLLAILEEVATDDRTSLEEKHQALERTRLVSKTFDNVVQAARPRLLHELVLNDDDLQSPLPLLIHLLQRDGLSLRHLHIADAAGREADTIDSSLLNVLSSSTTPSSFSCKIKVSPEVMDVFSSACFSQWAQLRSLTINRWIIPATSLASLALLQHLNVRSVEFESAGRNAAAATSLTLTHLRLASDPLWPTLSAKLLKLTASSAPTLTHLALICGQEIPSLNLSYLSHLRTLIIRVVTTQSDLKTPVLNSLTALLDSCPPTVRDLNISAVDTRNGGKPFDGGRMLEDADFLNHLSPSLHHLVLHPFPPFGLSYLRSCLSKSTFLPHLRGLVCRVDEGTEAGRFEEFVEVMARERPRLILERK